jgi:hypothetical protein
MSAQPFVFVRFMSLKDVADTDGKPIPQLGGTEGDPSDRTERLKELVSNRGIQLKYSDAIYPAQGQCSPGKIVILPGQSAPKEFAPLVHEVAHALLHQGEQRAETSKRVRETEAEAVAFVVARASDLQRAVQWATSSCSTAIRKRLQRPSNGFSTRAPRF